VKSKGKEVPSAQVLIGRVDVRVGQVKAVSKHPTVDTMYVTEIDVGTGSIPVVTGVATYFTPEQLLNKKVCVIVNLGSAPCKGVESAGRMLCATSPDGKTKELLEAPPAAKVGESLTWPGVVNAFDDPVSSKNFSKLQKELTTNAERQAVYRGTFPFTSSGGIITLPTIANGTIA
jgi:aminoacyl tRNA synthase complex-interacting multifunctional protein 1